MWRERERGGEGVPLHASSVTLSDHSLQTHPRHLSIRCVSLSSSPHHAAPVIPRLHSFCARLLSSLHLLLCSLDERDKDGRL